jgi:hypothetical protein
MSAIARVNVAQVSVAQVRKARRRAERIWAIVICSALGGSLSLVGGYQIATSSSMRGPIKSGPVVRVPQQAYSLNDDDDIRTGSILITPPRGDQCRHNLFDNLTGQVWFLGFVSCEAALIRSNEKHPSFPERLQTISSAFRAPR